MFSTSSQQHNSMKVDLCPLTDLPSPASRFVKKRARARANNSFDSLKRNVGLSWKLDGIGIFLPSTVPFNLVQTLKFRFEIFNERKKFYL